jgi:hypothetical protein
VLEGFACGGAARRRSFSLIIKRRRRWRLDAAAGDDNEGVFLCFSRRARAR